VTELTGSERLAQAFESTGKRAALMPYLMGGYPDLAGSLRVGEALAAAGADLVELGVPFSDPLADGPVIQAAGQRALEQGATYELVLDQVAAPLARQLPVVLMCYANQIHRRGDHAVVEGLADLGVSGLIVPDLPFDEAKELRDTCDRAGVALVPLVAPTTPPERIEATARIARGFIYVVSVTGVTGERSELPPGLREVVAMVRDAASVPVAVGFGVATAEQAGQVGEIADGVIVGSRLVRAVAEASSLDDGLADVGRLLGDMAAALRR
jgi:tryptophan synthase alpha chain